MSIKLADIKVGGGSFNSDTSRVDSKDLKWDSVPAGTYPATMVIVYPWKEITKDTEVRIRDDKNKLVRGDDGNYLTEFTKNVTWHNADVVFRIDGGTYDNHAVRMSLSTHPNMVGSAKQFLYRMGLFDVSLDELKDHTGATGFIVVKNKNENYIDKNTGMEVNKEVSYVSYIAEADASDNIGL